MGDTLAIARGANGVARITLDRPAIHNAFDDALIAELTHALRDLGADGGVRVVVLQANGKSFCAGADVNWMKRMADYTEAENLRDARALAEMLHVLDTLPKPTIARVQGAAMGGGVGLIACCDMAVAASGARFALSEARLGLIPATISPYVVAAIGSRAARRYFLTGESFDAAEALSLGLVNEIAPDGDLDRALAPIIDALLDAGPAAQAASKELIRRVASEPVDAALREETARRIAAIRASREGREGLAAFLAKRPPSWRARSS